MNRLWASVILLVSFAALAGNSQKGEVKPNWWLADFNKRDEAYYLALDQIRVGWTQAQVVGEFGQKYRIVESKTVDGKVQESWRWSSYRARQFSDPVDKLITVDFADGIVVNASDMAAEGDRPVRYLVDQSAAPVLAPTTFSPSERMTQLQQLRDQGLITPEEFEAKKSEILKAL